MAKTIELSQGKYAIVSDEDYGRVSAHSWHACDVSNGGDRWYARTAVPDYSTGKYRQRHIYLHRFILDAPDGMEVDHVNGNGLDNRRSNIRLCTRGENARNRQYAYGASRYMGVRVVGKYYHAYILYNGESFWGGSFISEKDAARAYDRLAIKHHGEFASLNFEDNDTFDWSSFDKRTKQEQDDRRWGNQAHVPPRSGKTYKGVFTNGGEYFIARIQYRGKKEYLGASKDPVECAHMYDERAFELYGGNCYLNFPENFEQSEAA